ncbi:MAG TPA: hypothetical protein VM939_04635 [Gemmatimonadaceae bacterium]|nr:hypothetical protein [Gemmatimonadaceae bacterium]
MGYPALLLLIAVLLTIPVALWIRRRSKNVSDKNVNHRIVVAFALILTLVLSLSALDGYFHPFGWPGHEVPGLRSSAEACRRRYAEARNPAESLAIDTLTLAPSADTLVFSCGTLRRNRLTNPVN